MRFPCNMVESLAITCFQIICYICFEAVRKSTLCCPYDTLDLLAWKKQEWVVNDMHKCELLLFKEPNQYDSEAFFFIFFAV